MLGLRRFSYIGRIVAGSGAADYLLEPVDEYLCVRALCGLGRKTIVGSLDDAIGNRSRPSEGVAIVRDHLMRNDQVMLGLDDQCIAGELRTRSKGVAVLRAHGLEAIRRQVLVLAQLRLRQLPVAVPI